MSFLFLFLFLINIALIAYFMRNYEQKGKYFSFLLKRNKIGDFFIRHDFIYFMICFFSTATFAIGAIYFFLKVLDSFI